MHTEKIDCRRLLCPLPVIRVQDRVEHLTPGTIVEAVCTDPGAMQDIPAWCRMNGHELIEATQTEDDICVIRFRVADHLDPP
jgi:tRNA 2-thiouridine synthesizing protein A